MIKRRKYTAEYKARVVLDMLTTGKSAGQASREYGIKDSVLSRWRQEFIERSPMLFEQGQEYAKRAQEKERIAELERLLGRLTMELEMAKKVSSLLNSSERKSGEL